jgi:acyl dehydratase
MIDRDALLAMPPIVIRHRVRPRDCILYALGVGEEALPFVYEAGLKVLPTMAVVLGYPGFFWQEPRFGANWRRILHGEQFLELHAPLPTDGEVVGETRIIEIWDKGPDKGAIALHRRTIRDSDGKLLAVASGTSFLRGDGGCGGPSIGQPKPHPLPDRAPDRTVTLPTSPGQALLYRLSGDLNPLHIDPAVAAAAGFERPILHGLATYGVVGRALLGALAEWEPSRIRRLDARFSAPVYPGETIATDIWHEGSGKAAFRARVVERDLVVLTNGYAEAAE